MSPIAKFIDQNTARRTVHQVLAIDKSDPCTGDYQRIFVHSRRVSAEHVMAWPIRNENQSCRRDDLWPFTPIEKMNLIPQTVVVALSDPSKHYQEHSRHIVVRMVSGHIKRTITSRQLLDKLLCGSHPHMPSSAWPLSEWRRP